MRPFKVGDRVACIKDYQEGCWRGMKGTVAVVSLSSFGVDFGRTSSNGSGHCLEGKIHTDTGWWFNKKVDSLKLILPTDKQLKFDF